MSRPDRSDGDVAKQAATLTAAAGRAAPHRITRLAGGRNNQVYRLDLVEGMPLVLKRYFTDARDGRDRLAAEWSFISRAWDEGLRNIPQPLACDSSSHAALYAFLPGRKLRPKDVTAAHVWAAADFIAAINARPWPEATAASEACFSIDDHLAIVERRLARLASLEPHAPRSDQARAFVARSLRPAWDQVKAAVMAECRPLDFDPSRRLAAAECRLSPSDFGFHNALVDDDGRLTFLDFEYAGRDDPAKLATDFVCQPEVPIPATLRGEWRERLMSGGVLDAAALARSTLLMDACRIKWACIMLNDFLPLGDARRAFADADERDRRCAVQLAKAARAIDEIAA